jgi:hypothetical protein
MLTGVIGSPRFSAAGTHTGALSCHARNGPDKPPRRLLAIRLETALLATLLLLAAVLAPPFLDFAPAADAPVVRNQSSPIVQEATWTREPVQVTQFTFPRIEARRAAPATSPGPPPPPEVTTVPGGRREPRRERAPSARDLAYLRDWCATARRAREACRVITSSLPPAGERRATRVDRLVVRITPPRIRPSPPRPPRIQVAGLRGRVEPAPRRAARTVGMELIDQLAQPSEQR